MTEKTYNLKIHDLCILIYAMIGLMVAIGTIINGLGHSDVVITVLGLIYSKVNILFMIVYGELVIEKR